MDKLKTIYSQISWREYDQIMEQILYNKFGRLLEEKMGEYEKVKKELKQNVKRIIDDPKALPTPARRPKQAIALTKRINELKELQKTAKKDDQEKEQIERDKKAQKNREDQLKERAERAKKEREERSRRVQKNNQIKEAERKDQEELIRARLAEQKKFTEEQKRHMGTPKCERTPAKLFNNAFRSGTKLITAPTIGVPKTPQTPKAGGTRINDMIPMNNAFRSGIKMIRTSLIGVPMAVPQEKMREPLFNKTPVKAILTNIKTEEEKNYSAAVEAGSSPKNSFKNVENVKLNVTAILSDGGSQKENDSREHHPQQTSEDEVVEMTELDEPVEISNYDITKEKILIPATEDNYNVDDLSSADETDPEDSPRKQIPKWAQKENLKLHVLTLNCILSVEKIERHFGRIKQPTVLDFFNHTRKKYAKRRSSSATWESPMSDPTPGYGRFQKIFQRS